jgi:hypothetical protein
MHIKQHVTLQEPRRHTLVAMTSIINSHLEHAHPRQHPVFAVACECPPFPQLPCGKVWSGRRVLVGGQLLPIALLGLCLFTFSGHAIYADGFQ